VKRPRIDDTGHVTGSDGSLWKTVDLPSEKMIGNSEHAGWYKFLATANVLSLLYYYRSICDNALAYTLKLIRGMWISISCDARRVGFKFISHVTALHAGELRSGGIEVRWCLTRATEQESHVAVINASVIYQRSKSTVGLLVLYSGMRVWKTECNSFIRLAQRIHCSQLIIVPLKVFHRMAETIGDPKGELVFVFNVARCGSTLLTQVCYTDDRQVVFVVQTISWLASNYFSKCVFIFVLS
jgi:hypothetical protein